MASTVDVKVRRRPAAWVLKVTMAVTGLLWAAFVLIHLYGNTKVFFGADSFNGYAHWLRHADCAKAIVDAQSHANQHERTDALVRQNVVAQLANIRTHPSVAVALAQHRLNLHGWIYDIENGVIDALDGATGDFVPLADNPQVVAT